MSNNEIVPGDPSNELIKRSELTAKQKRTASTAKASSDFYGGVGWVVGLFISLFVSAPVIWLLTDNATRSTRSDILLWGVAIAWWFNPLSLCGLGYIFSNVRSWRFWTILALLLWAFVNVLVSAAILDETARILIAN